MSKRKEGVDYPLYVKHDYFDHIDSERKAYFLGLIYADGCINTSKNGRQMYLTISLQIQDKYLLDELCKDIMPTRTVKVYHPPAIKSRGWQERAVFKVSSDKICNAIVTQGCGPNKSRLGMQCMLIPSKYWSHFVRGFFDGDGCIYIHEPKYKYVRKTTRKIAKGYTPTLRKRITLCSTSKPFLQAILDSWKQVPGLISKPQWQNKKRTQIVHLLSIEGKEDVEKIKEYFYKDATIYMTRKFDKFNMTISSQAKDRSLEGSETT